MAETAATAIAIVSLLLSIYVIRKDRKNKRLDNLIACRQRIIDAFDSSETITYEQFIDYTELDPFSAEAERYHATSEKVKSIVDRELEFACYLVCTKQIDLIPFVHLFGKWLKMRKIHWESLAPHKQLNLPFTWKVIELSSKKRLLPGGVSAKVDK